MAPRCNQRLPTAHVFISADVVGAAADEKWMTSSGRGGKLIRTTRVGSGQGTWGASSYSREPGMGSSPKSELEGEDVHVRFS
jgi:hypothetical protein